MYFYISMTIHLITINNRTLSLPAVRYIPANKTKVKKICKIIKNA